MPAIAPAALAPVHSASWAVHESSPRGALDFGQGISAPILFRRIVVNETRNELKRPVKGLSTFLHRTCQWGFWVDPFGHELLGTGSSIGEARRDWELQGHGRFQSLYCKRPFEMTPQEEANWESMEELIDVAAYRTTTPVVAREIGWVRRARPLPKEVEWVSGRKESVPVADMPAPYAGFKPGQWFEAIVARDPVSGRFLKGLHVERIRQVPKLRGKKLEDSWASLPTADLPAATRKWSED